MDIKENKSSKNIISSDAMIDKSIVISIGKKYGCMQVLDDGDEYISLIDNKILDIEEEKMNFVQSIKKGLLIHDDWHGWNGERTIITPAYVYKPINFEVYGNSVREADFDEAISKNVIAKEIKHYKCQCKNCGKIRFFSEETLQSLPKECMKPMYCSSKFTYSVRAKNATYRKRLQYEKNESVCLVGSKDEVIPSDEYCDSWNARRKKELARQAEKDAKIIASLPRRYAMNYEKNYVGIIYESYEVLECVDEKKESVPIPYYTQQHHKEYRDIIVYKQYRCRCYLCGREKMVTCDKFGIFPPTQYGYRAYNGYWSEIYCDCHPTSSFQWIVCDILLKHGIDYRVEISAEGLLGEDKVTPLRYDFGIYKNGEIAAFIECQGEQHYKPIEEFGGGHRFAIQQRNDNKKRKYAQENKIQLVEISYKDKKYERVEEILKEHNII